MALHLARRKHGSLLKPPVIRLFSTSPENPSPPNSDGEKKSESPFPSYFSDVKASLKQQQQQQQRNPNVQNPNPTVKTSSFDEIRQNLSQFRLRSATQPNESTAPPQQHTSFREMYKQNATAKSNEQPSSDSVKGGGGVTPLSFNAIRESLKQMREKHPPVSMSFGRKSLHERGLMNNYFASNESPQPLSMFEKEKMKQGAEENRNEDEMRTDFVRLYTHKELGLKLSDLRPDELFKGGGEWSWLEELTDRLANLRKMEEKETSYGAPLKDALLKIRMGTLEQDAKKIAARWRENSVFGTFGKLPPQEHLVEKYNHPDNMSSAEKMKLELQRVTQEFKMSESDCGSARVQVATLTTKINHLAKALHKKVKRSLF
ncbi:uncharacterized protein [Rutidosis leptorrhynchoides]|uniref:uncharacterized protein n=1 Tax=Rutidosis leptorrhynchoides TaxID=125765 RepID=UPI003A98EC08